MANWIETEREAALEDAEEIDDVCVCGVYRSEHALCGCPEGFTTAKAWEREKAGIREMDAETEEAVYGWH